MLGCLDLELHPLSQLEFQDALLHIAEQMNTVPLGVSLDSHDPALMLVTPNKLLGKFKKNDFNGLSLSLLSGGGWLLANEFFWG